MAVTKQQLATENAALRSRLSELEGLLKREREARGAVREAVRTPTPSGWKAAMEAARAEAIRTGRAVKVQF